MKHQNQLKPIGKCKGCRLNLKKRCGVFIHPKEMWDRGHCKGFMNEDLYQDYLAEQEQFHAKTPRELRQERSKRNKAEPHHDGLTNPGASRW